MKEQSNQDSQNSAKNIKRNPSNPKYNSPKTNPPEISENDQNEFGNEEGEDLNFDSEIEGDRSDQTEVDCVCQNPLSRENQWMNGRLYCKCLRRFLEKEHPIVRATQMQTFIGPEIDELFSNGIDLL